MVQYLSPWQSTLFWILVGYCLIWILQSRHLWISIPINKYYSFGRRRVAWLFTDYPMGIKLHPRSTLHPLQVRESWLMYSVIVACDTRIRSRDIKIQVTWHQPWSRDVYRFNHCFSSYPMIIWSFWFLNLEKELRTSIERLMSILQVSTAHTD